jgi:hypothetical protein
MITVHPDSLGGESGLLSLDLGKIARDTATHADVWTSLLSNHFSLYAIDFFHAAGIFYQHHLP